METVKELKNNFMCLECGKEFIKFESLKKHCLSIHSEEIFPESKKAFNCDICQKSFSCETSLEDHMKDHDEKNFQNEMGQK